MNTRFSKTSLVPLIRSKLDNVPLVSFYAKTRGWPFVIAWVHRISGMLMVLYIWVHIYTLSFLATPDAYDAKMKLIGFFPFAFLEWLLAVPIIFHALNGGRLILYEIFGRRNDESMIRWVLGLSATYFLLLGLLMVMGNQTVSPIFFWLIIFIIGFLPSYVVAVRIRNMAGSITWKLQRISGAYLIVMIPAHLLFMHLQPAVGHEAGRRVVSRRIWSNSYHQGLSEVRAAANGFDRPGCFDNGCFRLDKHKADPYDIMCNN
jgi:succinate dehydrogenase / fumarate reductase cytochrome b subunit